MFSNGVQGPRDEASNIGQDLDAVRRLYPEYSDSCTAVLKLRPPSSVKWLHDEDIKHRKITAKLHPKQKAARTHFETSYPKLLKDHMEYMEQVRRLVWDNTTRRSELSTTIACNTNAEKVLIDRFSTADAIAVPYRKLELEQSCLEYRHAPVLNPLTRNLEEGRIVILGRDIDPGSEEDIAGELLIACLERYPPICEIGQLARGRAVHETILRMESSQNMRDIYEIVSSLSDAEVIVLLGVILTNSRVNLPLLNLTNRKSASKLRENPWNRPALVDLMKDVNQSIKGILKACIFAYTITHHHVHIVGQILLTGKGIPSPSMEWPLECILTRWDCDAWCPLGENMVWAAKSAMGEPPTLRRMKRFPGISEDVVFLEVDEEGNIMDTPENAVKKMHINEEEQSSSSFSIKKLRKLMS
ncbi:hypothetical protein FRB91_010072 [Serendipita sp. 411]|nr:hypothetical protein FRB91_010072 [Serendipita sp. 411]